MKSDFIGKMKLCLCKECV